MSGATPSFVQHSALSMTQRLSAKLWSQSSRCVRWFNLGLNHEPCHVTVTEDDNFVDGRSEI